MKKQIYKEKYIQRGYIYRENIYIKEQTYKGDIYTEEIYIRRGHIHKGTNIWGEIYLMECINSQVYIW